MSYNCWQGGRHLSENNENSCRFRSNVFPFLFAKDIKTVLGCVRLQFITVCLRVIAIITIDFRTWQRSRLFGGETIQIFFSPRGRKQYVRLVTSLISSNWQWSEIYCQFFLSPSFIFSQQESQKKLWKKIIECRATVLRVSSSFCLCLPLGRDW